MELDPHLQHMQKSGLSGIVKTEEEKLRMLIQEAKGGQDVPNYIIERQKVSIYSYSCLTVCGTYEIKNTYTS